jgi:hypothetical protein
VAVFNDAVPAVATVAEGTPLTTPDRLNAEVVLVVLVVVVLLLVVLLDAVLATGAAVAAVSEEELEPPPHALNVMHAQ